MKLLLILSLVSSAWAHPRLTIPQQFFDPRTAKMGTFDLLESLTQDVNCGRHPPGQRTPNGLVGKITDQGFELRFARPLCPTVFLLGGEYTLCLDGLEVGEAKFVSEDGSYFVVQTDAETALRLQSALAP